MIKRDLKNNLDTVQSLAPKARTASENGAAVDLAGYGAAMVVFDFGLFTNGSFTPSVEESDSENSGFAAVSAGDLEGSLSVVDSNTEDNVHQRVGYKGNKRYIRAVLSEGSSPAPGTGCVAAASVVRGCPDVAPLA